MRRFSCWAGNAMSAAVPEPSMDPRVGRAIMFVIEASLMTGGALWAYFS